MTPLTHQLTAKRARRNTAIDVHDGASCNELLLKGSPKTDFDPLTPPETPFLTPRHGLCQR
jgi:hypothetical protein